MSPFRPKGYPAAVVAFVVLRSELLGGLGDSLGGLHDLQAVNRRVLTSTHSFSLKVSGFLSTWVGSFIFPTSWRGLRLRPPSSLPGDRFTWWARERLRRRHGNGQRYIRQLFIRAQAQRVRPGYAKYCPLWNLPPVVVPLSTLLPMVGTSFRAILRLPLNHRRGHRRHREFGIEHHGKAESPQPFPRSPARWTMESDFSGGLKETSVPAPFNGGSPFKGTGGAAGEVSSAIISTGPFWVTVLFPGP